MFHSIQGLFKQKLKFSSLGASEWCNRFLVTLYLNIYVPILTTYSIRRCLVQMLHNKLTPVYTQQFDVYFYGRFGMTKCALTWQYTNSLLPLPLIIHLKVPIGIRTCVLGQQRVLSHLDMCRLCIPGMHIRKNVHSPGWQASLSLHSPAPFYTHQWGA